MKRITISSMALTAALLGIYYWQSPKPSLGILVLAWFPLL